MMPSRAVRAGGSRNGRRAWLDAPGLTRGRTSEKGKRPAVIERPALRHASAHAPLYERVRLELTRIALERALTDTSPLPAEPRLMEQFGVSRGTLRRAVDALVREGVLYTEQGRGTFVNQEERVRRVVFDHLAAVAVPDSRSDLDLRSFVPDFD